MKFPLVNLATSARVWVYQAERNLTEAEVQIIQEKLDVSFKDWAAHGQQLAFGLEILHGRFLVVAVDEQIQNATGCSIDASTRHIQTLGATMGIDFFDRSVIFCNENNLHQVDALQIKKAVIAGTIQPTTTVFDSRVATLGELRSQWQRPASDTWLGRYFTTKIEA